MRLSLPYFENKKHRRLCVKLLKRRVKGEEVATETGSQRAWPKLLQT